MPAAELVEDRATPRLATTHLQDLSAAPNGPKRLTLCGVYVARGDLSPTATCPECQDVDRQLDAMEF